MKKNDFMKFNVQLNLSIALDSEMKRLNELIKLCYRFNDDNMIRELISKINDANSLVSDIVESKLTDDVNGEE